MTNEGRKKERKEGGGEGRGVIKEIRVLYVQVRERGRERERGGRERKKERGRVGVREREKKRGRRGIENREEGRKDGKRMR